MKFALGSILAAAGSASAEVHRSLNAGRVDQCNRWSDWQSRDLPTGNADNEQFQAQL